MSHNRRHDSPSVVQLITFGRRGEHRDNASNRKDDSWIYDSPWKSPPPYHNGSFEIIIPPPAEGQEQFQLPVRLDPGWDSMAQSTSLLRVNSVTEKVKYMEENPPKDRFKIVYLIMLLHGISIFIPWIIFINAKAYFEDYKLNAGNASSPALTDYRTNFMSYVGIACQYPNFILNFINLFFHSGESGLGSRIILSIISSVVMFVLTIILAIMDTSDWCEIFFWVTMVSLIVISGVTGIYQSSIMGLTAMFPMKYTNAVIFGNNVCGTLVALTNILILILAPDQRTAAIYYFVVAIVVFMVAFDGHFLAPHCKFYRHYIELQQLKKMELKEHRASNLMGGPKFLFFHNILAVFKQIWHLLFGVWFTFFITLSLFPAVMSDVYPAQVDVEYKLWSSTCCFLLFYCFAMIGNAATEFIRWPNARWINVLIILRVLFVPLMLLGNFRPETRTIPVYIPYDAVFIISVILFAFTSGYCSSLVMMYAPRCVDLRHASTAGMMMALFLVFGILCGVNFSRLFGIMVGSD